MESKRLALKLPRMFTAYELWVNGDLIATAGKVGKSRETMTPQYLLQVALFESQQGVNEILIKVSNFYHRSGGILESINLGSEKQILGLRYENLARDLILFGSLMCNYYRYNFKPLCTRFVRPIHLDYSALRGSLYRLSRPKTTQEK